MELIFIDISDTIEDKINALNCYKSQMQNDYSPRTIQSVRSLAQLHGSHIGCKAAEAFVLLGEYQR